MDELERPADDLFAQGAMALRQLLGSWAMKRRADASRDTGADVVLELSSTDEAEQVLLLVDLKNRIAPRDVTEVLLPKWALIRQVDSAMHLLVMAPWIAPRVQEMLRGNGIGYIDLTGNVSLRVARPPIVIQTDGAAKPPRSAVPRGEPKNALAGLKAGRLVRLLVDVAPPYRGAQVAKAAGLSLPWVSKLLGRLEDQLLIRRDGRLITHVDWPNLLWARAETFDLLRHNTNIGALAPNGVAKAYDTLRLLDPVADMVVTGSYAARAVAPVAAGGQLMLYVEPGSYGLAAAEDQLGLLRVDDGAEVLLLSAHDTVVFERPRVVDGAKHVALSQLALDCLSGPGRMPAEGEAIVEYMVKSESSWRANDLSSL